MDRTSISGAPPLNEYKSQFLKRRWLQTWLGGLELWIHEEGHISASVHFVQLLLFFAPAMVGISLNLVVKYSEIKLYIAQIVSAGTKLFLTYN